MLCRIVFAKTEDLEMGPDHLSFHFLIKIRISSYFQMAAWIFLRTYALVTWSMYEMLSNLRWHLISKACVLFSSSAVKVHDSQACRNMDITRQRISSPLVQGICYHLSILATALPELQWLVLSLREPPI